jgi:small-conductance mechanosensitive channel
MSSNQLLAAFAEWWTPQTSQLTAAIVVGSLLVWWRSPESRTTLRKTLLLILVTAVALLLLRALATPATDGSFKLSHGILILVIGAMVIRLAGLVLFQVVFELLRIRPPSILEEILVVVAWFAWAMLQMGEAGVSVGEILTTSAIATAVLAFAMQDTLGNILGGLALQWDHSLQVGDWIRLGDVEGKIIDIRWRAIIMETRNWETVVIPNGEMMRNRFKVLGQRSGEARKWRR